ncbi:MAG: dihydrolipoamide acetyltransferase family protein [Spirochaetia bacterium]|jgi:pyruvate dehydrogenase E2 component (dihydrolipoamide acetyltransferase)
MSHEAALFEFRFPDIGEGLTEGTIVELKVAPGGKVKQGDPLAIVETDKVVTEMPSPVEGTVVELRVVKGQVVQVGEIVARIRPAAGAAAGGAAGAAAAAEAAAHPAHVDAGSVVGRLETTHTGILPPSDEGLAASPAAAADNGTDRKVRASPMARKLAAEAGIDLARLSGTGPGGRILTRDLAARAPATPASPHGPGAKKLSTMRLAIAMAMEKSQAIPAAAVHDYTIIDELLKIRHDMNETAKEKVGLLAFFVKAVAHALKDFPLMSSIYSPEKREYESFPSAQVGVAVDTEEGLVVPVVRDPAGLSVNRIHAEILRLTEKARSRLLLLEEIRGGTFTISNFGSFSGIYGNPMILPPQVGILGIGRVHQQPEVKEGAVVPASILPVSLVVDHRLIDGVYACRFLARFMELVSRPLALLML